MRRLLLAALAVSCLAPATAGAAVSEFGSELALPANLHTNHGSDTSYWNIGQGSYTAPAEGQVTIVKLKGGVHPNARLRNTQAEDYAQLIHFQVLRPKGDGNLKVVQLSTNHLELPLADEKQAQELVTSYRPVNLCVKRGDIVAFNTIGAHEYRDLNAPDGQQGARYQVFGRAGGQSTWWYEKDNGLNEGTTIDPSPFQPMDGWELLMRTTLATGPDATDLCPGGYAQHIFRGLEFKDHTQPTVRTKTSSAKLKIFCHGENYGGCIGDLKLDAVLDGIPTLLGEYRFNVPPSHTHNIDVPISAENLLKIQRARRVTANITAVAHDNPRKDDRVKWDSVPVQELTTADTVVLTPDRMPCVVPKKLVGKSSKVAKAALRKAGCVAVVKYKKTKKAKEAGRVLKVSAAAGAVLPANGRVTLTIGKRS